MNEEAKESQKIRILLVDDERDITSVMKMGLETNGNYIIDSFNDPKEALAHFKPGYYDSIILDIRMPSMDGFQLSR